MESFFKHKHRRKLAKLLDQKKRNPDLAQKSVTIFKKDKKKGPNKLQRTTRSTSLTDKCRKILEYSKFRAMNEFIYENSSEKGFDYMKDEAKFGKYHEAYEKIMEKWPVKPVEFIAHKIEQAEGPDWEKECSIADLGCGRMPILKQKLPKAKVYSFDVVSTHQDVVSCNIASLPLKNHSCHYAVFSLSLMATNIKDFILEANRILKRKGLLLIAEVASRFADETIEKFIEKLKSYGFDNVEKEFLPPNEFFVFFVFAKKKDVFKSLADSLPDIRLKSCLYKPR